MITVVSQLTFAYLKAEPYYRIPRSFSLKHFYGFRYEVNNPQSYPASILAISSKRSRVSKAATSETVSVSFRKIRDTEKRTNIN